ncbi:17005_t:CDS:2 [Entrophospora sp. SA101]|nr:8481_t:CDS:2 [Entrophospora sp. SA101]CAJ0920773.1 17005_t:CDS:2 [Entrophospora sp. SA101]
MEASGGSLQQDQKHALNDSGKISNTEDQITLIEVSLYKLRICKEVEAQVPSFHLHCLP